MDGPLSLRYDERTSPIVRECVPPSRRFDALIVGRDPDSGESPLPAPANLPLPKSCNAIHLPQGSKDPPQHVHENLPLAPCSNEGVNDATSRLYSHRTIG